MNEHTSLLRGIPKVDELLGHPLLAGCAHTPHRRTQAVRETLDGLRRSVLEGGCTRIPTPDALAQAVLRRLERGAVPSLRPVLNATGIVLHTNLGRAPLGEQVIRQVVAAAEGYSTLEYNLGAGSRGSRYAHVEGLLAQLTGAEEALVVNNNAAAVLLILSALTKGGEVVLSRGELVEIGGSFRVPEVMEQSGSRLVEVGTTNKTHPRDYENAITPDTKALLKVHTSNFKVVGFTQEVSLGELVEIGRRHSLPVLHDLGSGLLTRLEGCPMGGEPTVLESLAAGVDVLSFSGDKLLGGPQAGIILGRKALIQAMKKHPLTRALRVDKMTLAALEATLRLYLDPAAAREEIPTLAMLTASPEALEQKGERLLALLKAALPQGDFTLVETQGQVGGGSAPGELLPSFAVALESAAPSVTQLEERLRHTTTPVIGRIAKERLLFDVRTLVEADFPLLVGSLGEALAGETSTGEQMGGMGL